MLLDKFVLAGLYCIHFWITIICEACRNAPKEQYKHNNNPVPLQSGTYLIVGVPPIPWTAFISGAFMQYLTINPRSKAFQSYEVQVCNLAVGVNYKPLYPDLCPRFEPSQA